MVPQPRSREKSYSGARLGHAVPHQRRAQTLPSRACGENKPHQPITNKKRIYEYDLGLASSIILGLASSVILGLDPRIQNSRIQDWIPASAGMTPTFVYS